MLIEATRSGRENVVEIVIKAEADVNSSEGTDASYFGVDSD